MSHLSFDREPFIPMQDPAEVGDEMRDLWFIEDIDRCVGCFTCEVACKLENGISEGNSLIKVEQVGPESIGGKLVMDFVVIVNDECDACHHKVKENTKPPCVTICPTNALALVDDLSLLQLLKSRKRIQILKKK